MRQGKVDGMVHVAFVVGPSGSVYDGRVTKSLSPACDDAALAAVRKLPRFAPGKQNGKPVAVRIDFPIKFWGPGHLYWQGEVATRAEFPAPGLSEYVGKNLRLPAAVEKEDIAGRVLVDFVVRADGRVRDVEIKQKLCAACDEEALRLVRAMPVWRPAKNAQGEAVAVHEQVAVNLPPGEQKVYTYVEQMPELPGGGSWPAIQAALKQRIPAPAAAACAGTRVYVSFVVKPDGAVSRAKIERGINNGCDAAVLAAVRQLPRFVPGKQNGQAVSVSFTIPVIY